MSRVGEINSFTSKILLLYVFIFSSLPGEKDFHFSEVKTGSVSGVTFFKKKKKSETNYLICRAESFIPLTKSVQCALPLTSAKRLTSLDYS